jgi:hypothetical protein
MADETFLEQSDVDTMGDIFRVLWNTRRLMLEYPTATILRYTDWPNPESISETTITDSRLNITEDVTGRTLELTEGVLSGTYVITGYTYSTITVDTATFLVDGFTNQCTYHVDAIAYRKRLSPTRVQLSETSDGEALVNREVAYYNLTENELRMFGNELDFMDKRFVFYDVEVVNNDDILFGNQRYNIYKVNYNSTYQKSLIYGKAVRK